MEETWTQTAKSEKPVWKGGLLCMLCASYDSSSTAFWKRWDYGTSKRSGLAGGWGGVSRKARETLGQQHRSAWNSNSGHVSAHPVQAHRRHGRSEPHGELWALGDDVSRQVPQLWRVWLQRRGCVLSGGQQGHGKPLHLLHFVVNLQLLFSKK